MAEVVTAGLVDLLVHFLLLHEDGAEIGERGRWCNSGGSCGTGRTIFWGLIAIYFRTWQSGTLGTTPTTTSSWGVYVPPPQGNTHIISGAGHASHFDHMYIRQGRRQTQSSLSCCTLSQNWTNRQHSKIFGFLRRRIDSSMRDSL